MIIAANHLATYSCILVEKEQSSFSLFMMTIVMCRFYKFIKRFTESVENHQTKALNVVERSFKDDKAGMLFIDGSVSSFDAFFYIFFIFCFPQMENLMKKLLQRRKSEQKVLINCRTCGMKSENSTTKNGSKIEAKWLWP